MPKDDSKVIEYALGILDKEARETVEDELSASSEAARVLHDIEEVLVNLAFTETPVRPSNRLRKQILASPDENNRFDGFVERLVTFFNLSGDRIRELLSTADFVPHQPWEPSGVAGISFLHFDGGPRVASADCGFVHVEPETNFPAHRHFGEEWVFVIQGRAQEDSGKVWAPGDLVYRAPDSAHSFRVIGDEPFIYAVVLQDGFEWSEEVNTDD